MKRVVILSAFLSPFRSGAEACAEEVALRLSDRFAITIVTAKLRADLPRHDLLRSRVPILRVGVGHPIDKWLFPFLAPFAARKLQPNIIHAVLESFAGLALLFCRWIVPSANRMLTLQTTNRNFLRGYIVRAPHAVTAISEALRLQAIECARLDVTVIPNGIPYEEIRKVCGDAKKVPGRLLFVGRLETMKGVDRLLRAVALMEKDRQWTLHIVGAGSQRLPLEQLAERLNVVSRVRFLGRLDGAHLLEEYAEAEIFCGLSRSEALGNVFLEAQAAGCAVIATMVGGIPEIVKDGVTGILLQNADDVRLSCDVITTMMDDATFRDKLAAAAVDHVKKYDWNLIAEQYASVYLSLTH